MVMEAAARAIGARAGEVATDVDRSGACAREARGGSVVFDGAALPRAKLVIGRCVHGRFSGCGRGANPGPGGGGSSRRERYVDQLRGGGPRGFGAAVVSGGGGGRGVAGESLHQRQIGAGFEGA